MRVRIDSRGQFSLEEQAVARCKVSLRVENIERVPNSSKRFIEGNIYLSRDSSEIGNILIFAQGVYSYDDVYFRLRDDDIRPIIDSLGEKLLPFEIRVDR
jgi:hypothetical protein